MSVTIKKHPDLERASSRRKQVLDAAETCFSQRGFHGASMAEISKAAGMSAGHIYNYFDGKDAIIAAFVQQNVDRGELLLGDLELHANPLQSILDDVEKGVHDKMLPGIWKLPLEIFAEAARNPTIAALVQAAELRARGRLRVVLTKGRALRGLTTDAAGLDGRIDALFSMFQGLHMRRLHNPSLNQAAMVAAFRLALTPLLFGE